jgi:hypothetical protein
MKEKSRIATPYYCYRRYSYAYRRPNISPSLISIEHTVEISGVIGDG